MAVATRSRLLALAALLTLGSAGCDRLLGYQQNRSEGGAAELGSDGPLDLPIHDGRRPGDDGVDRGRDWPRPPPDLGAEADGARADGARADGPRPDVPKTDGATADGSKPLVDGPRAEAAASAEAAVNHPACETGGSGVSMTVKGTTFVFCAYATGFNQCEAEYRCNQTGGWKLCPASTYAPNMSTTGPVPPVAPAWISGRVRSDGAVHAPYDFPLSCTPLVATAVEVSWNCMGQDAHLETASQVGIVSSKTCRRLGKNAPPQEGHWEALPTDTPLKAAVCCQ